MSKQFLGILSVGFIFLFGCRQTNPLSETINFAALGDSLTRITFDTLSLALNNKIEAEGIENAIDYCKFKSELLTKIYGAENISIKRTSLKVRNTQNTPDDLELSQINYFQSLVDSGAVLKSKLVAETTGKVHYFKAIIIEQNCLSCHGDSKKDINLNTLAKINKQYPDDNAVNFKTGDLRGLWHITFRPFANAN